MNIRGIYKTSLIDFPGKISAVFFSGGCNLRCRFCHNPDLACNWRHLELSTNEDALNLVRKRKKLIDGVTITGGEPTLSNNIFSFIHNLKELSLDVKVDTNGLQPEVIKKLINDDCVDYVAVDVKTSKEKYSSLTNCEVDFSKIVETINILRDSGILYELRTTCIPGFVTMDDLASLRESIGPVKRYYLQQFINHVPLLDGAWNDIEPYPEDVLWAFREFVLTFAEVCEIRGV